jgi:hypothetical protein
MILIIISFLLTIASIGVLMSRKNDILNGVFTFPKSIKVSFKLNDNQDELLEEFAQSVFNNWLVQDKLNTSLIIERFNDDIKFFAICQLLHIKGWMTFDTVNNTTSVSLNDTVIKSMFTDEEISQLRYEFKWNKYMFKKTKSTYNDLVKLNNRYSKSGIIRNGFKKVGNNTFRYDLKYLNKYKDQIIEEIIKKMEVSTKEISYQEMVRDLIEYYLNNDNEYTLGNNISDSRGRSIFDCTHFIGNPVSHKPMRALIVLPNPELLDYERINDVYLTIAELHGERPQTLQEKVNIGIGYYLTRKLTGDLSEDIWLERIYDSLDEVDTKPWDVPLEYDVTSSVLTIMGVLTNNHELLDLCNLINPEENKDAWTVDYCSRNHIKKAITPRLYGSSASPNQLWDKAKLEYDQNQLNLIQNEIRAGRYREPDKFKDYIIENVEPKETMEVRVWNDKFLIKCNRFNWESTELKSYLAFNSGNNSNNIKYITREVSLTPDLEQFKRFFVTLLVHCCDSQIADYIGYNMDWTITNHDAFLVSPNNLPKLRKLYIDKLYSMYENRHDIIRNYFKSVGINYLNMDVNTDELSKEDFSAYNLK